MKTKNRENRKGQVFILGSFIFISLFLTVVLSTGPVITNNPTPDTPDFFSQTLDETSTVFNKALEENRSIQHVKRRLYSYDRFLERRSKAKGIEFSSYHVVLMPDEGEAAFINYFDRSLDIKMKAGDKWSNATVESLQSNMTSFEAGRTELTLIVDELDGDHTMEAATPKLLTRSQMESSDETWINTLVG